MGHRIEQVNSLLQKELSELLIKEVDIPKDCFVTVTKVQTTNDLDQSTVYVSILPTDRAQQILKILGKNVPHLRTLLKKKLVIRKIPNIHIEWDRTEEKASRIEALIDKIQKEE